MILGLGYIGVRSDKPDDWSDLATRLLGMQAHDPSARRPSFRMDERAQRLFVLDEPDDNFGVMGWEVGGPDELGLLAAKLESAGVAVRSGSPEVAAQRRVRELIVFRDPDGNGVEVFHGAEMATTAFAPGRAISGFRTGAQGMGHAVLAARNIDALLSFYRDLLGFRVTDFGRTPYRLFFFHVNGRHHSFAFVESTHTGLHHFMVELLHLDDVGQGYELFSNEGDKIAYTLGRHTNDHMLSFYAKTPENFFVEYGWGARSIDPSTWRAHETFDGPSLWGHDRLYMDAAGRRRLRDMRLDAAARGVRAPLARECIWLDALVRQP